MMQEMTTVTKSKRPYMILEAVEFLQLGHRAQPAVQAVEVKQQARLVKLSIPPMLVSLFTNFSTRFQLPTSSLNFNILCFLKKMYL